MDISKGRYWDKPWLLVDGCTPCSPGCEHCWSANMAHRFTPKYKYGVFTDGVGKFNGYIETRHDRLDIPLRTRKPTVFAVWNDLFHEDVPDYFIASVYGIAALCSQHAFIFLTKRGDRLLKWHSKSTSYLYWTVNEACDRLSEKTRFGVRLRMKGEWPLSNVYNGLTVCNQPELDAKIVDFLKVPGKKFISYEPALGPVDFSRCLPIAKSDIKGLVYSPVGGPFVDLIIAGGETGPGARPLHPDWVRSARDQCVASGTPYFFKQWGEWGLGSFYNKPSYVVFHDGQWTEFTHERMHKIAAIHGDDYIGKGSTVSRVGSKRAGRLLDGQEWNELPWRKA